MADEPNPRRLKRDQYSPKPETLALLKVSGNPINGLGETAERRPSQFLPIGARGAPQFVALLS